MESFLIKTVNIEGLHDQHDLTVDLKPGLNILYGKNGTGKTTFLHVLANLLDRDISRFVHLRFRRIVVLTDAGTRVELSPVRLADTQAVQLKIDGDVAGILRSGQNTPDEVRHALRVCLGGRPVYLPAFRSVLEAISQSGIYTAEQQREAQFKQIVEREEEEAAEERSLRPMYVMRERSRAVAHKTLLCRDWFGPFVPTVRFPSLWEVSEEILAELQDAQFQLGVTDREAFSAVFIQVLRAVLAPSTPHPGANVQQLLASIQHNLVDLEETQIGGADVYSQIAPLLQDIRRDQWTEERIATRILTVYERALRERKQAQTRAYATIRTFESSVNKFLTGKELSTRGVELHRMQRRHYRALLIQISDGRRANLNVLSSGERHVLTLLFSATHMSVTDGMLLIDEPELSLHVGWQRIILEELMKQAGARQIVACTHAPEVAAHHRHAMEKLSPQRTESPTDGELSLDLGE